MLEAAVAISENHLNGIEQMRTPTPSKAAGVIYYLKFVQLILVRNCFVVSFHFETSFDQHLHYCSISDYSYSLCWFYIAPVPI